MPPRRAEDIEELRAADEKLHRGSHRADVGADIDDVRDKQEKDARIDEPGRIEFAQVAGDAAPVVRPMRALTIWIAAISG